MRLLLLIVGTVAGAALLLSLAVATASARRLDLSEQKIFIRWPAFEFEAGLGAVRCPLTLSGSFHSKTLSKTSGQLIGYINRGVFAEAACTGGTFRTLPESLPWHIQYRSFAGTLPNITLVGLQIVGLRWLFLQLGVSCLYIAQQAEPLIGTASVSSGRVGVLSAGGSMRSQTAGCPGGSFRGAGTVSTGTEGSGVSLTIRLVQ
jgi:hypothetical protein